MFANGLDMKAERKQNTATLYAKIDGEWTKIAEQTLAGGKGAIGFSASAGDYEITDFALDVKPLEDKTFSLTLKDGEGSALADETEVIITDPRGQSVTKKVAGGAVTLQSPYFGDYIVEVDRKSTRLNSSHRN